MKGGEKIENDVKPKVLAIIPARFNSRRVPQKMLKDICGKPLIQRAYERTCDAQKIDEVIIVTDADEVEEAAKAFGAKVLRSVKEHPNGTDRAAEALTLFTDFTPDIVVTIWGDEPTYPGEVLDQCIDTFLANPHFDVVIPSFKIETEELVQSNSVGKAVIDKNGRILYLSRSPIPYNFTGVPVDYYHASGAIITRPDFLKTYASLPRVGLEAVEDVEQLRILENGYTIGTVKTDHINHGVNTPEDLEAVIQIYKQREQN